MYRNVLLGVLIVLAAAPAMLRAQVHRDGMWWNRTSYENDTMAVGWRAGASGSYGFSMTSGNADGTTHNGDGAAALRYGNVTLLGMGRINMNRTSLGGGIQDLDQMAWLAGSSIGIDVTENIRPEVGGYMEGDNTGFLSSRNTAYAGATFYLPVDSTLHVSILPAVGVQTEIAEFTNEERTITTAYVEGMLQWAPTPRLMIHQTVRYWQDVRVFTGASDVYRIQSVSVASTPVFDFLDLQVTLNLRYNHHPIPTKALLEQVLRDEGLQGTIVKFDTYLGCRINVHI